MRDRVFFAQLRNERGERRRGMPVGAPAEIPSGKIISPGNDMDPCDGAEFLRPGDPGKLHEICNGVLVGASGAYQSKSSREKGHFRLEKCCDNWLYETEPLPRSTVVQPALL